MAQAYMAPDPWYTLSDSEQGLSTLDTDFCIIRLPDQDEQYYIRCILILPVIGSISEFHFGVWISVSKKCFDMYENGFFTGNYDTEGCFGYLMHSLPGFPSTWAMHCDVEFKADGLRPEVYLHQTDHPLYEAQQGGVSLDYVISLAQH